MRHELVHKDIIEACKKGKSKAKYQLYQLYSKAMFNVCYRIMHNREEAEDMLQEAFVLAFSKLESFRFESSFGAWLKRIVINTCINAINKRKADLVYCEEVRTEYYDEEKEEPEFTVDAIKKAMELLPSGGRLVFSLYLLEGYDHSEIAQILEITESTSKSQYMRARRRMIEILKQQQMCSV